ncbi:single-stranded DNA-binding protein [Thalassotalea sp. LPB0316]|uniref:single-stranded DNA-binding protein n=1 Tax=Thalassotalea sp. LPB0316 TaxID=2769490 RepID=UPI00186701C7|nr:single-stranded DNA-binding protein [Thalassotalea sp. LPB0316]QOL26198.1 single-stranded DNA-binding protein [Thalassotalea sp. LPB0316]
MTTSLGNHHLCKVTLLGNLVAKPEVRYSSNPVLAIAEITLATHSRWFDKTSNQFKEWTDFHTIKVIGDIVEEALLYADKGDVMLIHGYMLDSAKSQRQIIHANFAQHFAKGYAQSINLVQLSGEINAPIKLLTTASDKQLAELSLAIKHQVYSPVSGKKQEFEMTRLVHVWGKQAQYIANNAQEGSQVVVEGKLSYQKDQQKTQFIEAKQTVVLKS